MLTGMDPGTIFKIVKTVCKVIGESKALQIGVGTGIAAAGGGIAAEKIIDATARAKATAKEADTRSKIMTEHPELIPDEYWIASASKTPKNPKKGIWGNGPKQSHADQYF